MIQGHLFGGRVLDVPYAAVDKAACLWLELPEGSLKHFQQAFDLGRLRGDFDVIYVLDQYAREDATAIAVLVEHFKLVLQRQRSEPCLVHCDPP